MTKFEKWKNELTAVQLYDMLCICGECFEVCPDTDICKDGKCTISNFEDWANTPIGQQDEYIICPHCCGTGEITFKNLNGVQFTQGCLLCNGDGEVVELW